MSSLKLAGPLVTLLGTLVLTIGLAVPTLVTANTAPVGPTPNVGNAAGSTRRATLAADGFLGKMGATVGCTNDPSANLGALVTFFICTLSRYATAIAVLIIMTAGVMYIISGSNPATAGTAKAMIITTITGLVSMYAISLVLSILISSGIVTNSPNTNVTPTAGGGSGTPGFTTPTDPGAPTITPRR